MAAIILAKLLIIQKCCEGKKYWTFMGPYFIIRYFILQNLSALRYLHCPEISNIHLVYRETDVFSYMTRPATGQTMCCRH
jgi:hypothetical protein